MYAAGKTHFQGAFFYTSIAAGTGSQESAKDNCSAVLSRFDFLGAFGGHVVFGSVTPGLSVAQLRFNLSERLSTVQATYRDLDLTSNTGQHTHSHLKPKHLEEAHLQG